MRKQPPKLKRYVKTKTEVISLANQKDQMRVGPCEKCENKFRLVSFVKGYEIFGRESKLAATTRFVRFWNSFPLLTISLVNNSMKSQEGVWF